MRTKEQIISELSRKLAVNVTMFAEGTIEERLSIMIATVMSEIVDLTFEIEKLKAGN